MTREIPSRLLLGYDPEFEGSTVLRNIGVLLNHNTASQSRRTLIFTAMETSNLATHERLSEIYKCDRTRTRQRRLYGIYYLGNYVK